MTSTGKQDSAPVGAEMMACYRLAPGHSRFTVQAFAGGLMSFLAHSPTFLVGDFAGELRLDPETLAGASLQLTVRADSLTLVDRVRPADREEIEGRMRGEVLETRLYPEIRFDSAEISGRPVAAHQYQLHINGRLSLHGVTNPLGVDAQLQVYTDGVRLTGEAPLRLSEYRIRPVTALGGAIRLNDQLRVAFDLVAWKEGCRPEGP
jgi:polyisoprenoid-binding protein YceI